MRYFTYYGKSCLDILGDNNPLVLVSMDGEQDDVQGSEKKVITGETSIYKTIANEYGNMYDDVLEFEYSLIKFNDELITREEQRTIETWLTSPKLSQYLQLFDLDCDGDVPVGTQSPVAIYCGTFIETSWIPHGNGYIGVTFTFRCDAPYAWQFHEDIRYMNQDNSSSTINVVTDDTEDYVYPRISITAINEGQTPILKDIYIVIHHHNADNILKTILLRTQISKTIVVDCKSCRVTDNAGNNFRYDDVGWEDVGNIYWPRLTHGINSFETIVIEDIDASPYTEIDNVNVKVVISYMSPIKIVGGWL